MSKEIDELMEQITKVNKRIDDLCYDRDVMIERLNELRTESDSTSGDLTGAP